MLTIEDIAKIAHQANKAYCESQGDYSLKDWEQSPDWQKKSIINGVLFHLENPERTPEQSHENWLKEKITDGWKYGHFKDPDKKEHPCCVPYDKLPEPQKVKDYLFSAIVASLAPFMANEVVFPK